MRLAEQHEDHGPRVTLADFGQLGGSMAVASADLAQIFARHAIEAVQSLSVVAGGHKQAIERSPVVSPVEVEADSLVEFVLVDITPPPFVENVLVAGKNGLHAKYDGTIADQGALLE